MNDPISPIQLPPAPPEIPQAPEFPKPAEFNPPPQKKSFQWIFIVLLILLLLLVPVGLVCATENGYIDIGLDKYYNAIGLEKLWGGLPIDARLAFYQINQAMSRVKSYHFDISADVDGDISANDVPGITRQIPLVALKNSGKILGSSASSIAMTLGFAGDFESPNKVSGSFSISLTSKELTSLLGSFFGIDFRLIDNKMYFKAPALSALIGQSANKWILLESTRYRPDEKNISEIEDALKTVLKSDKRLSGDFIKGQNTYHYQLILDKNKISEMDESLTFLSDPKIDVWIGKKDHLIYKMSTNLTVQSESPRFLLNVRPVIQFSDFNKTFNIAAPPSDEIASEGPLGIMSTIAVGEAEIKARDARRKGDLKSIKLALETYKKDKGKYPVSSGVDKTNNKDGVLYRALVPKYMKELPVDPKDPVCWYGYISDGTTFTLWSLLENKNDSEGKQDGAYFKYILTND